MRCSNVSLPLTLKSSKVTFSVPAAVGVVDRVRALSAVRGRIDVVNLRAEERERVDAEAAGERDPARESDRAELAVDREDVVPAGAVEDDLRDAEDAGRQDEPGVEHDLEDRGVRLLPRDRQLVVAARAGDPEDRLLAERDVRVRQRPGAATLCPHGQDGSLGNCPRPS